MSGHDGTERADKMHTFMIQESYLRAVTFLHPGVKTLSITCWTALPVLRIFSDLPSLGILPDPQRFEYFRTALPAL